jgi:FdhD protein
MAEIHLPITAAVFARSLSKRTDIDEVFISEDDELLISRIVEIVSQTCEHVLVVADHPEGRVGAHLPGGVRVLHVTETRLGPLGGLAAALDTSEDDWVLLVNADVPWLRSDVIRSLWGAKEGAQVVIPIGGSRPEPALVLCHRDCLPSIRQALESGRRRLVAFLPSVRVIEVPLEELRLADGRSGPTSAAAGSAPDASDGDPSRTEEPVRPIVIHAVQDEHGGKLPAERPITVYMNTVEIATIQGSPSHLEEMAVGFLLAEGLIQDREALESVDVDHQRGFVFVETKEAVPDELVYKKRYITSGCGKGITFSSIGHAKNLDRVTSELRVDPGALLSMMGQLSKESEGRKDTGGVHGCAFGRDGELILVREDIGRHNAVDKLLGRMWLDRIPTHDLVLLSTGRVSYEMAVKAAKARVPIVVTRHAVTDLAADITEELGVTLVAYCRGNRMVVCTHAERIEPR